MSDQADSFTLNADSGFYERTVSASDLLVPMCFTSTLCQRLYYTVHACITYIILFLSQIFTWTVLNFFYSDIILSYSLTINSSSAQLSDGSSIRFDIDSKDRKIKKFKNIGLLKTQFRFSADIVDMSVLPLISLSYLYPMMLSKETET